MSGYVALLRGINVGGNNVIRMADLKAAFEDMGFEDVRTYIQSGNVVFRSAGAAQARIATRIEKGLNEAFDCASRVAVRSHAEITRVVEAAPPGFGADALHRWYVVFMLPPASPADVLSVVSPRPGVDAATVGEGVVYFSTLISAASRSSLTRMIGTPVYQNLTIRNWNTTVKLMELSTGEPAPRTARRARR